MHFKNVVTSQVILTQSGQLYNYTVSVLLYIAPY